MSVHVGGTGIFPGSFNPPHKGHIKTISLALECFDVLHMFVRYNEGVDLVDWETKKGWFERINEDLGGRLVIHKMENKAIRNKTYKMEDFFDFIRSTIESVGEPVSGFVFGDDYEKILPAFREEFPQLYFLKGERPEDGSELLSSTAIRNDLEGHKSWLPDYVYETLHRMKLASEQASDAEGAAGSKTCQENRPCAEEIDISGCPVLGSGFASTVYGLDEETIVKVYKEGTPWEKVEHEFELSRIAYESGVPSVRAYRVVRAGASFGLVLEKLSSSMGRTIHQNPGQMESYVEKYAALAKKLHSSIVTDKAVPSVRDRWLSWAQRLAKWCSPDEVSLVSELVSLMPEADTFLHGDLHPGNIMFRGEEPVLIDMTAVSKGSYLADLAVIYRGLIMGPKSANLAAREKSMGMNAGEIRKVGDLFFMKYMGLGSRKELEELYSRLHLLYALSVVVMCGNERMKDDDLARLLMDELLRKVVVPGKDTIAKIWQNGGLLT